MVFEAEPQLLRLVEARRLRRRVRVAERVGVRAGGDLGRPPHRVAPAHQVTAVEVVVGVDQRAGLPVGGDPVVELPPVAAFELDERGAVDVDARDPREPPHGVEHHGEVHRIEFDGCRGIRFGHSRQRSRHPQELRVEAHAPTRPRPADNPAGVHATGVDSVARTDTRMGRAGDGRPR